MKTRKDTDTSAQSVELFDTIARIDDQELYKSTTTQNNEIQQLSQKVQQLTTELDQTKEKLSVLETRYATLLNFIQGKDGEKIKINQILDKVDQLEKQFIKNRSEIACLKGKLLAEEVNKNLSICVKYSDEGLTQRKNLQNYFNVEGIRNNQEYLERKRKNSLEEQENCTLWLKGLENYGKLTYNQEKFKQKTQNLVKKFIPHEQRPKVWPLVFNNSLGITETLYVLLQEKRSTVESQVQYQIQKDIKRSFVKKLNFENKEALLSDVQQILELFHLLRPDISYIQGMTYPVIVLTIVVGKLQAFSIFSNLVINNKFFRNMYFFEEKHIELYWKTFDHLLKQYQPEISQRLADLKIKSEIFLVQWFFTFFSRGMSIQSILKIWDLLAYQNQLVFYKLALSIFDIIGRKILTTNYEETIGLVQSYWSYIDENRLLLHVMKHQLSCEKLQRLFEKFSLTIF